MMFAGKTGFVDGKPGKDWCQTFDRRHKDVLSWRIPEPLSKQRASGLTKGYVEKFYEIYKNALREHNIQFPWQICIVDESALNDSPSVTHVY